MQLSIIIVSFNTRGITRDCLQSIQDSRLQLKYEVIVVDNASWDGSDEMIKREFPDVILIRNQTNNMFAKANNQAMKIAKGNYFLLLNSDTIVEAGNIEKLYNFLDTNQPEVACVGPRLVNMDGSFQNEGNAFFSWRFALCTALGIVIWSIPKSMKRSLLPKGYPNFLRGEIREVGWVVGAAMMVSRVAVDYVGGLDEAFYFYGEETEWCYRFSKSGYKIFVFPISVVKHLGRASTVQSTMDAVRANKKEKYAYLMSKTTGKLNHTIASLILFTGLPFLFIGILLGKLKRDVFVAQLRKAVVVLRIALF